MNVSIDELNREKEYLKKTIVVIKKLIEKGNLTIDEKQKSIGELKRYIWENNGILDETEIAEEMYNVNVDVDETNKKIKNLQKLRKSLISAYFGRVDFESEGFLDKIYIGLNGISEDLDFYVFDWRSPVASLFYNYGIGEASYLAPIGKIKGNITLKRQYKINGEEIERCFDSNINIDDEYLQEILANSSTESMTNIVTTIQKEQNEIIRNVSDKYLIVQGIAGSGKTSVALHRIAYLLYQEKNLTSNNILIFSPNDVFTRYISNVLPELGEDNVLQTTFCDFAKSYIKEFKKIESLTSFIGRYYKNKEIDQEEYKTIKYKLSNEFKEYLDSFIKILKNSIFFNNDFTIGNIVVSKEELNNLLVNKFSKQPLFARLQTMTEYLCNKYNISIKKYGKTIHEKLRNLLNYHTDVKTIYENIITSTTFENNADLKNKSKIELDNKLNYEDLLPLLYLYFELYGYPKEKNIRHIVIDEVQDYTLLQLAILKKIFNTSSFTILGDIHQTINPYYLYENLNEINTIFDSNARYIELNKTYRSTQEIVEFSNQILGLNNVCAVRRSNSLPVIIRNFNETELLSQLNTDIERMKGAKIKRIAIITHDTEEAKNIYNKLKQKYNNICLIDKDDDTSLEEIVVLPSYISKGLEFDGVIAYTEENKQYDSNDRHLFYVVCTRAQHCLTVYNQKKLVLERTKNEN